MNHVNSINVESVRDNPGAILTTCDCYEGAVDLVSRLFEWHIGNLIACHRYGPDSIPNISLCGGHLHSHKVQQVGLLRVHRFPPIRRPHGREHQCEGEGVVLVALSCCLIVVNLIKQ